MIILNCSKSTIHVESIFIGNGTDKGSSDQMKRNVSSEALENGAVIGKVR